MKEIDLNKVKKNQVEELEIKKTIWIKFCSEQRTKDGISDKITADSNNNNSVFFLIKEWHLGYSELKHTMMFPVNEGFISDPKQVGDIFQRAMIASHLLQIRSKYAIKDIIDYEKKYFLSKKIPNIGWKYFPGLLELPADTDTLAQILQVFIDSSESEIIALFKKPIIDVLNSTQNGIFSTWIVSEINKGLELENINFKWGNTLDTAVIANIGYALILIKNKVKILEDLDITSILHKNASFLVNMQKENGFWETSWYANSFYGAYVIIRFLCNLSGYDYVVNKSIQCIIETQNKDGSFGDSNTPALNTALAVLSLLEYNKPNWQKYINHGILFLKSTVSVEGEFESSNFIRMNMDRAIKDKKRQFNWLNYIVNTRYYKSNTLCTSFCMLAIEKYNHNL